MRESAPMTTPPSYSTAMMVVCRGEKRAGGSASTMIPYHGKARRRWAKQEKASAYDSRHQSSPAQDKNTRAGRRRDGEAQGAAALTPRAGSWTSVPGPGM